MGSAKMIFLERLINGEQDEKKFSESDLSFASNSLLKPGAFGSRPRKQGPGTNDVKGGRRRFIIEIFDKCFFCGIFRGCLSHFSETYKE